MYHYTIVPEDDVSKHLASYALCESTNFVARIALNERIITNVDVSLYLFVVVRLLAAGILSSLI